MSTFQPTPQEQRDQNAGEVTSSLALGKELDALLQAATQVGERREKVMARLGGYVNPKTGAVVIGLQDRYDEALLTELTKLRASYTDEKPPAKDLLERMAISMIDKELFYEYRIAETDLEIYEVRARRLEKTISAKQSLLKSQLELERSGA